MAITPQSTSTIFLTIISIGLLITFGTPALGASGVKRSVSDSDLANPLLRSVPIANSTMTRCGATPLDLDCHNCPYILVVIARLFIIFPECTTLAELNIRLQLLTSVEISNCVNALNLYLSVQLNIGISISISLDLNLGIHLEKCVTGECPAGITLTLTDIIRFISLYANSCLTTCLATPCGVHVIGDCTGNNWNCVTHSVCSNCFCNVLVSA